MSDLIEDLHSVVTPEILSFVLGETGTDESKKNALGVIYALLLVRLCQTEVATRLAQFNDDDLTNGEQLFGALWADGVSSGSAFKAFVQILGVKFELPESTVNPLIWTGLPLAYDEIKCWVGSSDVAVWLAPKQLDFDRALPVWVKEGFADIWQPASQDVKSTVPTKSDTPSQSDALTHPAPKMDASAPTLPEPLPKSITIIPPKKRKKGKLWTNVSPFLAGLILSVIAWLMLKSCQTHPTRLAVPSAMTEEQRLAKLAVPATVSLALDETGAGVYALTGKVGNVGLGEEVKRAVVQVFGEGKPLKVNVVSNTASKMPVSQYLPQLFGFMKGVPNASVVIDNKTIWLNASDPTALQKMIANIDVALPKEFVVEAEPAVDVVTKQASDQAKKALDALSIDTTDDDIIQALNAQLFVFKENSADILPDSRTVLDKMASVLSAKALPLHIVVHTDNHGKSAQNKALSKSRAKAIKAYLVAKGVPAKQLTAHGVGDALPVASNATEQGRFKNSRVEFVLDDGTTPSMLVDNTVELSDVLPADDDVELLENTENTPENTTNEEMLIDGESWYEKSLEQDIDEQEPATPSVEPLEEAGEPLEEVGQ